MIRRSLLQPTAVFFTVVMLCIVAVGSVGAAPGQPAGVLQTDNAQTDGEQTQSHENPAEATEPDDDEGIESHLESILSDHLADSLDDAVDGDYEDARAALDEAYDDRLDQYADAAGDSQATQYDDARNRQDEFIDATEQFDERHEAYREARQDGDNERADELRDQLEDDATELSESGDELVSAYRTLETETAIDHSEEIALIERRQQAVDQFVSRTEGAGQVNTMLLVETDRTTVSFDAPARINGQLQTADGEPIADQNVTVAVEDRPYSVETDSAGQFEIVHSPIESVGETTLDIEYRPAETSEYRATQREIPVTIEPVDATVQLEQTESAASFETDLTTEGTVTAGSFNQPAADLPVGLFVDGEELATTETNETGEFSFSTAVPRSVDSGTAEIEVQTLETNGAINSASETTQVQIEPVPTRLAIETALDETGPDTSPEELDLTGQLETADGEPIPNATVDLTVDDETVETVTTADDGTFEETLTLPEAVDGSVTVGASFGAVGHLEPTTETVTLDVSADADAGIQPAPTQQDAEPAALGVPIRELLLAAGSMLALFGLVGLWWVRRGGTVSPGADDEVALAGSTPTESTAAESPKTTPASSSKLRSLAEQQLDAGRYNHAVVLAYAAVRRQLGAVLGTPDGVTHRELARSYAPSENDHRDALEKLTQQYERVRYAADPVDEPTAVRAVSTAERILDDLEQTDHDG